MIGAKKLGIAHSKTQRDEEGSRGGGTQVRRHPTFHVAVTVTIPVGNREEAFV
jgi:hypothetical protein